MLRIGDGAVEADLPNVWRDREELDAVLNQGVRRALQHATASAMAQQNLERKPSAVGRFIYSPKAVWLCTMRVFSDQCVDDFTIVRDGSA